jgi:hypothetical protein
VLGPPPVPALDAYQEATRVAFARDGGDVIKTRTVESPDYGELRTVVGDTI